MGVGVNDEGKLQTRPLRLPLVKQKEAGARWRLVQIYLPAIDTLVTRMNKASLFCHKRWR